MEKDDSIREAIEALADFLFWQRIAAREYEDLSNDLAIQHQMLYGVSSPHALSVAQHIADGDRLIIHSIWSREDET